MAAYTSLYERLCKYCTGQALAMHMPGHKRNCTQAPYLDRLGAGVDITEIEGFDNLHAPQGILLEAQRQAAGLWGAEESFFLVNGASGGILAMLYAALRRGDELLLARGSHKSVYHAIELCGLVPRFLLPPTIKDSGIFGSISPVQVEQALAQHPQVRAVFLTSPSYEGVISDIAGIARVCHAKGVLLLVDEAHGAHLGLSGAFPTGAVQCGADLVVQSLHKTLSSLTQTAILHRCTSRIDPGKLRHALAVFQTSSPSYLLMASIDGCIMLLREKPELLTLWRENLQEFDQNISRLTRIQVLLRALPLPEEVFAFDPGKILLHTPGLSGTALMQLLRENYAVELEMAAPGYALAMTGLGDTRENIRRFASVLAALDTALSILPPQKIPPDAESTLYKSLPHLAIPPEEALNAPRKLVPWGQCAGHIAAEYVWAYPPGIPMLIPGERIDAALAGALVRAAGIPGRLHASFGGLCDGVFVVCAE